MAAIAADPSPGSCSVQSSSFPLPFHGSHLNPRHLLLLPSSPSCHSGICFWLKKHNSIEYLLKTLLALLTDSRIGQHPIQQIERNSEELYKMRGFNRQRGASGTRKSDSTRHKSGLVIARSFSWRGGGGAVGCLTGKLSN